ncbi:MAG: 4Fe-4S binding protein [Burkholderiales bacterium]|nr:4Fe-4S binding protein [Burkholderiales bacterium]
MPAINPAHCTGCGWCVAVCPPHVLCKGQLSTQDS